MNFNLDELKSSGRLHGPRSRVPSREEIQMVVAYFRNQLRGTDLARVYGLNDSAAVFRAALVLRQLVTDGDIVQLVVEDNY